MTRERNSTKVTAKELTASAFTEARAARLTTMALKTQLGPELQPSVTGGTRGEAGDV